MNPENERTTRQQWDLVMRHFDEACRAVMEQGEVVSVEELQKRFRETYGFKPRAETVAKAARALGSTYGLGPLKTYYELNPAYFDKVGRHCPGTPRAWKKYTANAEELDEK